MSDDPSDFVALAYFAFAAIAGIVMVLFFGAPFWVLPTYVILGLVGIACVLA